MPLFQDRPVRSVISVAVALAIGHFSTNLLSSLHAFHLTQTSVAILAISALIFMVVMHHRREGQLMTQAQEEMVLIGGFALIWVVAVVAWRALRGGDFASSSQSGARQDIGSGGLPYGCSKDDLYCVVEEYSYF